jgi:hypothetical protein
MSSFAFWPRRRDCRNLTDNRRLFSRHRTPGSVGVRIHVIRAWTRIGRGSGAYTHCRSEWQDQLLAAAGDAWAIQRDAARAGELIAERNARTSKILEAADAEGSANSRSACPIAHTARVVRVAPYLLAARRVSHGVIAGGCSTLARGPSKLSLTINAKKEEQPWISMSDWMSR